jgi:hypothetical protein
MTLNEYGSSFNKQLHGNSKKLEGQQSRFERKGRK